MLPPIDDGLVRDLLRAQFPAWAEEPLAPVSRVGNDHRMFRLGDDKAVRLPSSADRAGQVRKEQAWLPRLAAHVPLAIPAVLGAGIPSAVFPSPWSVYGWLHGDDVEPARIRDDARFAADLAGFLRALRAVDADGGPPPGAHSFFRGGGLDQADEEVAAIVSRLPAGEQDRARGVWREARETTWDAPGVWVHGDVAVANLLARDGRLAAVLDFGCAAVGDPACDTVMRWTVFEGPARATFVRELGLDDATWTRGRGWALWKGLVMITNTAPGQAAFARRLLDEVLRP